MLSIQDNTLRDGMQQFGIPKNLLVKREIIKLLGKSKISSVEIGMCTTDQDKIILSERMPFLSNSQSAVILTRLKQPDISNVVSLHKKFNNIALKLLVPTSKLHVTQKLQFDYQTYFLLIEKYLTQLQYSSVNVDVCLEDATRTPYNLLEKFLDIISKFNIRFLTLADTVGCSTPLEYGHLFKHVHSYIPNVKLSAHCHNDLGLATANTLAAIQNGAQQIETTLLGIGERAGNTSLDEIMAILTKKKTQKVPLSLPEAYSLSKSAQHLLNYSLPPTKPILGSNIFKHESGIHQDGTLKNEHMYQYLIPSDIDISIPESFPISAISSSKVLNAQLKTRHLDDKADQIISFYKTLSQVVDTLTLDEAIELYNFTRKDSIWNF